MSQDEITPVEEARYILRRGHAKRDPHSHLGERIRAAEELVTVVQTAASQAGYNVGPDPQVPGLIVISHKGNGVAYLQQENGEVIVAAKSDMTTTGPNSGWKTIALDYDPVEGNLRSEGRSGAAVVAAEVSAAVDRDGAGRRK